MAGKQLITVLPDGSICGMDHKRKGFDLRELGRVATKRVTLIEWAEDLQKWFIEWTTEVEYPTKAWTVKQFRVAGQNYARLGGWLLGPNHVESEIVYFRDYEDAVSAEIAVIQGLESKGMLEGVFT